MICEALYTTIFFFFWQEVTSVSGKIKDVPKGQQRKVACINALKEVTLR